MILLEFKLQVDTDEQPCFTNIFELFEQIKSFYLKFRTVGKNQNSHHFDFKKQNIKSCCFSHNHIKLNISSVLSYIPLEYEKNMNNTKNIFYSCAITSSSYLTYNDDVVMNQLNSIIEAYQTIESSEVRFETQRKASKRIQIDAVQYCILRQSAMIAQQMYDEIQVGQFNVSKYYYLMNEFDLSKYQNQSVKITFDPEEESVWRIMEDFQAKSREAMGDDEFDGLNYYQYPDYMENQYETKVFGQSIDKKSNFSILIFASVFISFFAIMVLAYNALKNTHKKIDQKKEKKSKKQK